MKNLQVFILSVIMLITNLSLGQNKTVTGIVSDVSGLPLPGVTIVVKEIQKGTSTNIDGAYSITVQKGQTLVFDFIGFHQQSVKVGDGTVINVTLKEISQSLQAVVVTASGKSRSKGKRSKRSESNSSNNYILPSPAEQPVADVIYYNNNQPPVKPDTKHQPVQHGTNDQEDYNSLVENVFESPKTAPLSTFSIDVDNASYTNIRRFINNGQKVPKDAVRLEEMINFFKYSYPQPKDNNPFSITTDYSDCPWNKNHKLVRIGLQGKNIATKNLPASNLVFLIDVSGSMNQDNKLPLLIQSLKVLVAQLRNQDKVAIVVYAGAEGLVLPPTSGGEKQTIINALEQLNAGGSTAGGAGIQLAYKTAEENFIKGGNNRVILATDGDFNVGASSNADMEHLIEDKRKSGVFLTCLGYGMGNYKDSKMEVLANKGNGNYAYIDNMQEANRFLGKEFKGSMFAIAKDVKIQIEFNPKHVQSYRLIGYENRKLRPEDFVNDAIDAGELGSGHTVTALYEIIPTGIQSTYFTTPADLKYTKAEPTATKFNEELATIKFRYKKPDGNTSIEMVQVIENKPVSLAGVSDDFRFSAAVAWFGLKLRESKLIANTSSNDIKKLAQQGITNDQDGYKAEFIRLMETVNTMVEPNSR